MAAHQNQNVIGVVKEWIAPILISILGMFIWRDLTELREDVKFLVKEQNIGTVKIASLENRVTSLESEYRSMQETLYRLRMHAIKEENEIKTKPYNQ